MENNTTKLDKNVLYNSGFEYYVRKEYLKLSVRSTLKLANVRTRDILQVNTYAYRRKK